MGSDRLRRTALSCGSQLWGSRPLTRSLRQKPSESINAPLDGCVSESCVQAPRRPHRLLVLLSVGHIVREGKDDGQRNQLIDLIKNVHDGGAMYAVLGL